MPSFEIGHVSCQLARIKANQNFGIRQNSCNSDVNRLIAIQEMLVADTVDLFGATSEFTKPTLCFLSVDHNALTREISVFTTNHVAGARLVTHNGHFIEIASVAVVILTVDRYNFSD